MLWSPHLTLEYGVRAVLGAIISIPQPSKYPFSLEIVHNGGFAATDAHPMMSGDTFDIDLFCRQLLRRQRQHARAPA